MKKFIKIRRLIGLLFLALPATVQAQFNYSVNPDGTATITGYTGSGGAVTIPAAIGGLTVTSIGQQAFAYATNITSVTIPGSVTSIGDYAFYQATLNSVNLPGSVASIGYAAFSNCYYLFNNLTIPNSVTNVGDFAFYYCSGLSTLTINNSVIGNEEFANCVSVYGATIGRSVIRIGNYAFNNCANLASVTIPNSVTSIGEATFEECSGLTSATIPNSVTNLGGDAFSFCPRLTSVTIPNSVINIGAALFESCSGLTNVIIGNQVTGGEEFLECTKLTSVTIINNIISVEGTEFEGDPVAKVVIGTSATNVLTSLFLNDYLPNLTNISVSVSNSMYSSVSGVWFNKSQTELILFPQGRHGNYGIPNTVTNIGDDAFYGCSGLTGVNISDRVTSIGRYAFYDCSTLTSASIGRGVTSIGYSAFAGCGGLTSVTIPNSVTSIGAESFSGCSLTTVTIPNSVTNVAYGAFGDCSSLTTVFFLGNNPSTDGNVFYFDNALSRVYYLPGTTGWGSTFSGVPAELWNPLAIAAGVSGGHFGFSITGPTNTTIVVEATTNLVNPVWTPVSTNILSGGVSAFNDSQSGNYPNRYYHFRSP